MNERSILRVRPRPHSHPERTSETVVEVLRNGEVVATIYGTMEGIHIVSNAIADEVGFMFGVEGIRGFVMPLLGEDVCPWCSDTGQDTTGLGFMLRGNDICLVCRGRKAAQAK